MQEYHVVRVTGDSLIESQDDKIGYMAIERGEPSKEKQ